MDVLSFEGFPNLLSRMRKKKIWVGNNVIALNEHSRVKSDGNYNIVLERDGVTQDALGFYFKMSGSIVSHVFTYKNKNFFVSLAQSSWPKSPYSAVLTEYNDKTNIRLKCVLHNLPIK